MTHSARLRQALSRLKAAVAPHQRLIFMALPVLCYVLRAWPYIRHPQLFAEDGEVWLAQAHNHAARSLVSPYEGLLHTFERVWADVLNLLPLSAAPFLYNVSALVMFGLLCYYLFSERTNLFRSTYQMLFVSLSLVLADNIEDFYFNFSNSVFLLGMVCACIIVAKPAKWQLVRLLEILLFGLMCLTLPFAWVYVPMLAARWVFEKRRQYVYLGLALVGGIIQVIAHHLDNSRPHTIGPLDLFSRYALLVVYNQIIIPSFRFIRLDIDLSTVQRTPVFLMMLLSFLICLAMTVYAFWKANSRLRYIIGFFFAMTVATMSNPQVTATTAREGFRLLSVTVGGSRYWIFGIFLLFIVFAICSEAIISRKFRYYALSLYIAVGILAGVRDHRLLIDKHFADYIPTFKQDAPLLNQPGAPLVIPENPGNDFIILNRQPLQSPRAH